MSETQVTERTSLASRVRAGVALLDEKEPGWHTRVDADRLNIDSMTRCILGQLHGSYAEGADVVLGVGRSVFKGTALGFDVLKDRYRAIRTLNRLWSFVIRQRQAVSQ